MSKKHYRDGVNNTISGRETVKWLTVLIVVKGALLTVAACGCV